MSDTSDSTTEPTSNDNWIFEAELKDIQEAHDALVQLIDPALPVRTIAIMKEILWQGFVFEGNRIVKKYGGNPNV